MLTKKKFEDDANKKIIIQAKSELLNRLEVSVIWYSTEGTQSGNTDVDQRNKG